MTSPPATLLTTFASPKSPISMPSAGSRAGGIVPPTRGLRGVLDNIVQDGMRVATEVRKRVDDVGRELERSTLHRESEVDDDEPGAYGGEADRKSVREGDRDLLEGAEAEAGVGGGSASVQAKEEDLLGDLADDVGSPSTNGSDEKGKVEFER
ncbi:MAG: hypothetical protein Q9163_005676 [Psora crenata]